MVEEIGHYIVEAGGKRLRPLLVLLASKSLGYSGPQHIDLATIIEFIHTATLLHDDVVDLSSFRRNRATVNAKWGNAPSVLVGDFLYSRAFQMMVAIGDRDVMEILSEATNTIAEGEVLQLENTGDVDTTEERYLQVIHFKTARLFEAAAQLGAVIAGSNTHNREALRRFGHHLGMAFQLVDDVLDYTGDSETLGKNAGDDLAEGKPTLPLIYSMRHGSGSEAERIRSALRRRDSSDLAAILHCVSRCGALDYTREMAKRESETALTCLEELPGSRYRDALAELARFAVARSY